MNGNHGMEGRNDQQQMEHEPEDHAGHDQHEIEDRREGLPIDQQRDGRKEDGKDVDHREVPRAWNAIA